MRPESGSAAGPGQAGDGGPGESVRAEPADPGTPAGPRWDAHAHVIGDPDRYPLAAGRGYDPRPAPLDSYLALLDRLGLDRGVLVQPSVYGFDNRCLLDALDAAGGRLVGVAVPPPDAEPSDLEAMARRGVVGIRCNLINPGGLHVEIAADWSPTLRELGWHVAMQIRADEESDLELWIDRLGVPVVIDHMGRPSPGSADPGQAGLRRLIELVAAGACYVKLSAPYRLSDRPPPWPDITPLARALLDARPEACLWATDWPHTDTDGPVPENELVAALEAWCRTPDRHETVLRTMNRLVGNED